MTGRSNFTSYAWLYQNKIWCWTCLPVGCHGEGVYKLAMDVQRWCHKCNKRIDWEWGDTNNSWNRNTTVVTYEDKDLKIIRLLAEFSKEKKMKEEEEIHLFKWCLEHDVHLELGGRFVTRANELIAEGKLEEKKKEEEKKEEGKPSEVIVETAEKCGAIIGGSYKQVSYSNVLFSMYRGLRYCLECMPKQYVITKCDIFETGQCVLCGKNFGAFLSDQEVVNEKETEIVEM